MPPRNRLGADAGSDKTAWQAKREASYQALILAAMRCFYELGYSRTRVEDIVAGTGYTSGAFYFHFKNKAECFWNVLEYRERHRQGWQKFLDPLDPLDPHQVPLAEVVRRSLDRLAPEDGLAGWSLVMAEHFQQHRGDQEVADRFADLFRGWHRRHTAFVEELQRRGWIDPRRDTATISMQVLSFVEGMAAHAVLFGMDHDAVQTSLIDGVVRIMGGP